VVSLPRNHFYRTRKPSRYLGQKLRFLPFSDSYPSWIMALISPVRSISRPSMRVTRSRVHPAADDLKRLSRNGPKFQRARKTSSSRYHVRLTINGAGSPRQFL
jgi:hypothetical protein